MLYSNALLHNVEELIYDEEHKDYIMQRMPETVRQSVNEKAIASVRFASNSEIRFVMEEEEVVLHLRRMPIHFPIYPTGLIQIYQGDYQGSYQIGACSVSTDGTEIHIHRQDFTHIHSFAEKGCAFSPDVTRVLLPYDWGCCIGEIKGAIHPPTADQLPSETLLTYGSSITHGGNASVPSHTYAFRLAEQLGMDLCNLGTAGGCRMDPSIARYIASRNDWKWAFFELGVNVIGLWEPEELFHAAREFIRTVKTAHPEKPVFVTDMFYNHHDFSNDPKASLFRKAIAGCVSELSGEFSSLYYINGLTLMPDWKGLSSDGLHPSDLGHKTIGENLFTEIKKLMEL